MFKIAKVLSRPVNKFVKKNQIIKSYYGTESTDLMSFAKKGNFGVTKYEIDHCLVCKSFDPELYLWELNWINNHDEEDSLMLLEYDNAIAGHQVCEFPRCGEFCCRDPTKKSVFAVGFD